MPVVAGRSPPTRLPPAHAEIRRTQLAHKPLSQSSAINRPSAQAAANVAKRYHAGGHICTYPRRPLRPPPTLPSVTTQAATSAPILAARSGRRRCSWTANLSRRGGCAPFRRRDHGARAVRGVLILRGTVTADFADDADSQRTRVRDCRFNLRNLRNLRRSFQAGYAATVAVPVGGGAPGGS